MVTTSDHYQGLRGEAYFAWQRRVGLAGGRIEARKFAPWIRRTDVVLDYGCGTAAMLTSLTCAARIGVDVSPAARRSAAEAGVEVHKTLSEVPADSVDIVVSNHALEHSLDPYATCLDFLRVLVPGGRLVLCLPFDALRLRRQYSAGDRHHHLYTWTPQLIGNLLAEASFIHVASSPLNHAWPPGWAWLDAHLSLRAFDAVCAAWAVVSSHRQVMAFAQKPTPDGAWAGGAPRGD